MPCVTYCTEYIPISPTLRTYAYVLLRTGVHMSLPWRAGVLPRRITDSCSFPCLLYGLFVTVLQRECMYASCQRLRHALFYSVLMALSVIRSDRVVLNTQQPVFGVRPVLGVFRRVTLISFSPILSPFPGPWPPPHHNRLAGLCSELHCDIQTAPEDRRLFWMGLGIGHHDLTTKPTTTEQCDTRHESRMQESCTLHPTKHLQCAVEMFILH